MYYSNKCHCCVHPQMWCTSILTVHTAPWSCRNVTYYVPTFKLHLQLLKRLHYDCIIMHAYSDPNISKCMKKPILTLGRQPSSDVIVLSPTLHVMEDGTRIPSDESDYVWVESIMKKEGVIPSGLLHLNPFPACDDPLQQLLSGLA